MNYCGIICEFNPFHNGHKYLIDKAKEITGLDILCLMSGDFVQRGAPALQNKYTRAKNAIKNGASAVLEMPTIYACSNAENFAMGSIKILTALNVSHIAFGIEKTELSILQKIAKLKYDNSELFKQVFKAEMENEYNYSKALKWSIAKLIDDEDFDMEILDKANNILAIEYLTAILKLKSKIIPVAINRCDNGFYNQENVGEFLSATNIREKILSGESIESFIPANCEQGILFNSEMKNRLNMLQCLKIKTTPAETLNKMYDYAEGIEYRIKKACTIHHNFDEIQQYIESRRYRKARINKLLLYPLLKITQKVVDNSFKTKPVSKVLAINKNNKQLLKNYNKNKINLIVCNKDYDSLSKNQKAIIDIDLMASEIYQSVTFDMSFIDKKIGTLFI